MTHLDDAHAALMQTVASDAWGPWTSLSREQAGALLDEAARLVAERDAAVRERDEARAVLRPLLANPGEWCAFCGETDHWDNGWVIEHTPDCPTRRAGVLLGDEGDRACPD